MIVYVDEAANVSVPATVNGVRTMVIPTTARAVALGSAPQSSFEMSAIPGLQGPVLNQAVAVKQQTAQALMQQNPLGKQFEDYAGKLKDIDAIANPHQP